MSIINGNSGMPEDRFVNTWHFIGDDEVGMAEWADDIKDELDTFYGALAAFFNGTYLGEGEYRCYDLADPEPREPTVLTHGWTPGSSTVPLPFEVASCASFYSFRNIPRQRGRVYLGPLAGNASVSDTIRGPIPSAPFRTAVADAMEAMANDASNSVRWAVYSPTDGIARQITAGWVDDAWDTQRSRGPEPTARTSWELPSA